MDRNILIALVLGTAAVLWLRKANADVPAYDDSGTLPTSGAADDIGVGLPTFDTPADTTQAADTNSFFNAGISMTNTATWDASVVPAQYVAAIQTAEQANGLPTNMLARLLYQESHYNPSIINGTIKSSAGALGIAQFMPPTAADFGINPLDPFQSIAAAGRYLKQLYNATGAWDQALAAYNWGLGNLRKYGIAQAPVETRNYYTQILAGIGMSPTTA